MSHWTTLYLIRHAETYHNAGGRAPEGVASIDFSPRGVEQSQLLAAELSRRLQTDRVRLCSSDQQRAIDTLEPVRAALNVAAAEIVRSRDYCEFYRGELGVAVADWPGWLAEYDRQCRVWVEQTGGHSDDFKLTNGTSPNKEKRHTRRVLTEIAARHSGETVVLVAHGGFNQMALRELLGLESTPSQHNCCINVLTLDGGGRHICENVLMNYVAYLPVYLRPWEHTVSTPVPG